MQKSDITFQDKLGELMQDITHPKSRNSCFVLLEGDSDVRLFRKFFDLSRCKVERVPGGSGKLEECVSRLLEQHPLVLGIRDADFIRIVSPQYSRKNMILTDKHDIEVTMISFKSVLSALLFEYAATFDEAAHDGLRKRMMDMLTPVSYLKLANERNGMRLSFNVGFQDLISFPDSKIDFEQYLDRVLQKSADATVTDKAILAQIVEEEANRDLDLMQITNGHDLLEVFAAFFREQEGRKGIARERLESAIRMAFDKAMFEQTSIFSHLLDWQNRNSATLF
jgi:hypothetical protein